MNIADEKSLDAIFKLLKDDNCELVRHEAAFALGETASYKAVKILKEAYENDESLVVKHECLMSLGTIGTKEDLIFLKDKIQNEKFEISCSAKIAQQRINQTKDFETDVKNNKKEYINKLKDNKNIDQNERIQILFQLMTIADEEALEAILKTLKKDLCRIVRNEAAFVL
jgi:HEAT repeat protein